MFNAILSRVLVCDPNPFLADAVAAELEVRGPFTSRACNADPMTMLLTFRPHIVILGPAHLAGPEADWRAAITRHLPSCELLAYVDPSDRATAALCLAAGFAGAVSQDKGIDALIEALTSVRLGGVYVDHDLSPLAAHRAPLADASEPAEGGPGCGLSERERSVLEYVARGFSNKEIAAKLGLSAKTVETYRARGSSKLGFRRKSDIVEFALRHRWLGEDARAA